MSACIPYCLAWIATYFAHFTSNVTGLYVSRILVGLGHALVATTVYTVEISSRDLRATNSLLEAVLR